jgi:hypothetical protein
MGRPERVGEGLVLGWTHMVERFWWCGKWVVLGCWEYDGHTTDVEMGEYNSFVHTWVDVVGKGVGQRVLTMVKDL